MARALCPRFPCSGPDEDPGSCAAEQVSVRAARRARLAAVPDEPEAPEDGEEHLDPESTVLPPDEDLAAIEAATDRFAAERIADAECLARADTAELTGSVIAGEARKRGPRGPRLPGSADLVPGVSGGPAGGFGAAQCLDVASGSACLHGFVETAE